MDIRFKRPNHGSRPTCPPCASQANAVKARAHGDAPATTILSVSEFKEDHINLRRLLAKADWEMWEAYCCREAIAAIGEHIPDAVLCEARLPDGDWRDLLNDLSRKADPPCLIVTSRLADQHLWAEVLNLGGYDVLAKPFVAEEVCRTVGLACEHHQEREVRSTPGGGLRTTRGSDNERKKVHSEERVSAGRAA